MKIVLVGAGSAQFGYGTLGDIFTSTVLAGSEIVLHDINPDALKAVYTTAGAFLEQHKLNFSLRATVDRKDAFAGASFIISSIEVGDRFRLWDEDWKVPQQYGVRQVYGENGGAGGVFHALRIIPPILDIVRDAMEICPEAFIFNFSNPMTAICTTVLRAFPGARFIGMCHEIGWLSKWLPAMLDMDMEDISFRAGGLNHFSCMLEVHNRKTGEDLYPQVLARAHEYFLHQPGYSDYLDEYRKTGRLDHFEQYRKTFTGKISSYEWADRRLLKFILETYRLLPITVDSHFGEYLGWAWDVADHKGILDFYELYRTVLGQATPKIELQNSERVLPVMEGILTDAGYEESAVNIPNQQLVADLPSWIAVEVPAIVGKNGLKGCPLNDVPRGFLALLRNYCGVYDLIAEAVLQKSRACVVQALLANPVVPDATSVAAMVDHMIASQSRWLGYLT